MKQDKHRFLRKRRGRKPGKAGSSLALVMMIGAALVIWVMCIMPLMTTTGTTAIQTEEKYDDYLESRSSIEYCKSELENIVKEKVPYTFAVTYDTNGKFQAIPRPDDSGLSVSGAYSALVDYDQLYPTKDVPRNTEEGKTVLAICAVEWKSEENHYQIVIKTYHNGEPGQTYSLIYTLSGSLLIYPESYKQSQALPLSDFVVVDGIMGGKYNEAGELVANKIWKSDINMGNAVSGSGTGGFKEELLPWVMEPSADYANSQEYPAVFKKTAEAALLEEGGSEVGTPITDGDFTDEVWVEPKTDGTKTTPGYTWIETSSDGAITVKLYKDDEYDITDQCTIYLNGEKSDSKKVPTQEGYYTVTIGYEGDSDAKILPVSGLRMAKTVGTVVPHTQPTPTSAINSVVQDGDKYTVTMSGEDGVRYGYCAEDEAEVHWNSVGDNTFEDLEAGETYYFYAYRPAAMVDDGNGYVYKSNSNVQYVGRIFPKKFATELTNGGQYLVLGKNSSVGKNSSDYSAMTVSGNNLSAVSLRGKGIKENGEFFIQNGEELVDNLKWTTNGSGDRWSFHQGESSYLNMTGSYSWIRRKWNLSAEISESEDALTVAINEESTQATVSKFLSDKLVSQTRKTYGYLSISEGISVVRNDENAEAKKSYVYFLDIPKDEHTDVTAPTVAGSLGGDGMVYAIKNNVFEYVGNHGSWTAPDGMEGSNVTVNAVYANGTQCKYETEAKWLNAGEYYLTADITIDGTQYCVELGSHPVGKGSLPANLSIKSIDMDDNDELTVKVTATGWNIDIDKYVGGTRWFGYQKLDDNGKPVDDFKWYPATGADPVTSADELSYTFRLPYGTYNFAVREYGCSNYKGVESAEVKDTIVPTPVTLLAKQINEFVFTYDANTNTTVWYKLPMATVTTTAGTENEKKIQILPYRVKLVFGTPGDPIVWSETLTEDARYYGVKITASNFETDVLKLAKPIGITSEGGHTTSMMRGSSLYFMGQGASINTYGNSIYLTADLLVLNHDIIGGGSVYVAPYSTGEKSTGNTLLFAVNDIQIGDTAVFKEKTFYIIPKDTNIAGLSAESVASLTSYHIDETDKTIPTEVQYFFRQEVYPELNLDIAYANDKQLAHILSSETIGWTEGGCLKNSGTRSSNAAYVVCAYVNEIKGSISCTANRVLIAAKATDGSRTLNVPADLSVTTRYLSIDADQVVQGTNGVKYTIYNLGQDENFFTWLGGITGLTPYHSKTLQIDFERNTSILAGGNTSSVERQICRIDNETDLFANPTIQPLMVTYTASEINGWFNRLSTAAKTVDRYTLLKGDETGKEISLKASFECTLDIYTNYLYVDDSITDISVTGFLDSDIRIRSQESGYSDKEYLGLFTEHSTESYNGTLVYFANDVDFNYTWRIPIVGIEIPKTVTIKQGFYYVYSLDNGTSLKTLATDLFTGDKLEENTEKKPFKVDPNSLKDYSIYIDKDGNISNAYVDTGLFDNTSTGLGGFSGGNVG